MRTQKHISRSILCSLLVIVCITVLAACNFRTEHTHEWGEWTVSKDPTCIFAGEKTRICKDCGEEETLSIDPIGHKWGEATCTHPKTCLNCGEYSGKALPHNYTQEVATEKALKSEATCTEAAVYYKSCSCGEVSKNDANTFVSGNPLAHVFDQEIVKAEALKSAATCTKAAVYYKSCACGEISENDADTFVSGEVLTHVFDQETVKAEALKSAATCTEAAVYYKSCACGKISENDADTFASGTPVAHVFDQEIAKDAALKSPATPTAAAVYYKSCACGEISKNDKDTFSYGKPGDHTHSYTSKVTSPTCSEYGYTVYTCQCGYSYKEVGTVLAEHTWVKNADPLLYLAADATCDEAAEYHYSCSVCGACDDSEGAKTFSDGEALGHHYSWKSNSDGTHTGTCQNLGCQKTVSEACTGGAATCTQKAICQVCQEYYGEVLGHNWKDGAIISVATCTTAGQKTQMCQNDGCRATTTVTVPATGHNYQSVVTASTCTTQGYTTYTCQNCSHSYTGDYQAMADHDFGEWSQTKAATCTETGIKTRVCSCGASETETVGAVGHNYTSSVTPATCTTQGYTTYTCQNPGCTHSYLGNYVANGHKWDIDAPTCTQKQICSVCKAENEATGHSYELIDSKEATCTMAATKTYQCKSCQDSYVESVGTPTAHNIVGVTPTLASVDGETCLFVEHYACADCGADVVGEQVEKHNKYTATIQNAATCINEGIKVLTCADCGETKTETIPVDTTLGHSWVAGDMVDGKRTDTCGTCGETKTVTVVTENQTNKAEDLKDTELSVGGTNISFGDAAESIGNQTQNDVTIGAGTLAEDEKKNLGLDDEKLAQIGDNLIYNFTVTDTENNLITNFGDDVYVTISIPYTLKEGEDIDSIAIWFISDTGELEAIQATYNNGYITFKTNHFSYYTVTDLTPAERCALYGHNFKYGLPVDPTCTEEGYTLLYCIRCLYSEKLDPVDPIGHNFQTETVREATCTQEGLIRHTCTGCNHFYEERTPSLEHEYQFLSQTQATCTAAGTTIYQCSVCQGVKTEEISPLGHNCKAVEVIKPTCTTQGYTVYACQNGDCTYSYQGDYQPVASHSFGAWTVTVAATCKTVGEQSRTCTGCDRIETQVIPATDHSYVSVVTAATCDTAGYTTHTCTSCQNSYTDNHQDATSHDYVAAWNWAEDKTSAQITITCQNAGCRYNTSPVTETVTSECVVFDSTEKKTGRKEYSVHFEFDGESFSDLKTEVIPVKVHDHSNCEWQYNKFNHWYKCSESKGNSQKIPHNFDNGTVTKAPTCQSTGTIEYKCECGFAKTDVLPKTDAHIAGDQIYHDGEKHWSICTVCAQKCNENKHEWDNGTETKSATCTEKGSITYLCACGAVKTVEIPALGHTDLIIPGKDATCTESGLTEGKKCSVCDETIKPSTVIPALGHKYQDGYCINCGLSEVAPHEHIFDNACDTDCNFAGCKFTRDTEHVFAHDCDDVCDECGFTRKTEHTFDNACDPDCNVEGCGYIRMIYGHIYDHDCDTDCNECGYTRPIAHVFDNICDMNCNNVYCGFVRSVPDHEYDGGYCIHCGVSEVEPHEHFFDGNCDDTCNFAGCHFMRVAPHAYANDCDTECDVCGYMRWVPYHNYIETERVEATCTTDGYVTRVCSSCQDTFTDILYAHGHFLNDFVVLKEATCTEDGERQGTCTSCGETVTEPIYRTGHSLNYESVEFVNIGISCGGWSSREICQTCGDCIYFSVNDYYCAWSLTDSDEQNNEYTYTCMNCGAVKKEITVYDYSDTCRYQATGTYEYYVGGELVWCGSNQWGSESHTWIYTFEMQGTSCTDGYYVSEICEKCQAVSYTEYRDDHNTYCIEEYNFSEFGACYGHLYIYQCPCGENYSTSTHYCGLTYVSDETYTDSTGVEHTLETYACPTCGLTRVKDYYTQREGCFSYCYETYTFQMGDTVIGSYHNRWQNASYHQYEYVYVFDDEANQNCEAGVTVTQSCRNCDEHYESHRTYHSNDLVEYYDFTEYGACCGYYRVYKCPCGESAWEDRYFCDLYHVSTETYTDDAGIEHTFETSACPTCGLTRVRDYYSQREGCLTYTYEIYTYQMGDKDICSYGSKWESNSHHDLEYTYVFDDESNQNCEAGVTVTQTCRNCDYQDEYHSNYHSTNLMEAYDFTEWGACQGYLHISICPCGQNRNMNYYWCNLSHVSETYYTDAQGKEHTVSTYACSTCGFTRVLDYYDQKEGCYTYRHYHYSFQMAGEEICSYDDKSQVNTHHVYEYTYVFDDENNKNCEAGVSVTQTCRNCDYVSYDHTNQHSTRSLFDLRGCYDCCEEHYVYVSGCACGKEYQIHFESYTFEFDEQAQLYTCPDCALTVAYDVIEQAQDCSLVKTTSIIVELANVEIYSGSKKDVYSYHSFDNVTVTVNGEITTVTAVCEKCGLQNSTDIERVELEDHDGTYYYDYYFTPDVTASYTIKGMESNDTYVNLYRVVDGELVSVAYNDDGWGNQFFLSTELSAGTTYVYRIRFYNSSNSGSICFLFKQGEMERGACRHNAHRDFAMLLEGSKSCEDGLLYGRVCKECGIVDYLQVRNEHITVPKEEYIFSDFGACNGYLYIYECLCGESRKVSMSSCYLEYVSETTYTDAQGREHIVCTEACSVCGLTRISDYHDQREGCYSYRYYNYTYKMGDVEICSYQQRSRYDSYHHYEYTYVFDDETNRDCEAGVTVTQTCRDCDYRSENHYSWHNENLVERYEFADWGACYGYYHVYACPCGKVTGKSDYYCNLSYVSETTYTDAQGIVHSVRTEACSTCGLTRVRDYYIAREGCYDYNCSTYTVKMGNTEICSYEEKLQQGSYHHYEYTYVFNDASNRDCTSGVTVTQTCRDCDYRSENYYTWHNANLVERYEFADYGACYGYIRFYECPCGKNEYTDYMFCANANGGVESTYTDAQGREHTVLTYTCSTCNLTYTSDSYIQREGCYAYGYSTHIFKIGNTEICSYENSWKDNSEYHEYEYTFVFDDPANKNCLAGVTMITTCRNCDYHSELHDTGHASHLKEDYVLTEWGACQGHVSFYECPCGEIQSQSTYFRCSFTHESTTEYTDAQGREHYVETYVCITCGLTRVRDYYIAREGCYDYNCSTYTVKMGNTEICSYEEKWQQSSYHHYEYTYVFDDDANRNCEAGVSVTQTCRDCDYYSEDYRMYHNTDLVERYEFADWGACHGYLYVYRCPCGEQSSTSENYCGMSRVDKTSYTDTQGRAHTVETYACSTCGLTRVQDYYDQREGCYTYRYSNYTFKMGNVTIASYDGKSQQNSHHKYQYSYVFADETNRTCEAGVTVTQTCRNCDYFSEWYSTNHNQSLIEQYDLSDYGADGGYVQIYECPCGYSTGLNFNSCSHGYNYTYDSYTDEEGTRWYVTTYQSNASKCDCNIRFDCAYYYTYDRENCIRTTHYIESVVVGDTLVKLYEHTNKDAEHDCAVNVSLAPGATNCVEGAVAIYTCRYCDYSYTSNYNWHNTYEKQRIDLAQYGSVCGGYISIYGCACGIYGSWNLEGCDCAFEQKGTNHWIQGDINEGQETAEGWNGFYTYSYIYTCSVTHPDQCGFVIRVSEYWKKNRDCSATQYITLQFGYDEATGTYLEETTIQLETKTYHNYVVSQLQNGIKHECSDCSSYYSNCNYYNENGSHEETEFIYVNTLNDGNSKYREVIYEYYWDSDSRWNGNYKSEYHRTIGADGSESWYRYDHSYDNYAAPFGENAYSHVRIDTYSEGVTQTYEWAYTYYKGYQFTLYEYYTGDSSWWKNDFIYRFADGCERTRTYTSSDGSTQTYTEEAHPSWYYETVLSPTCTQYGLTAHRCPVCETIRDSEVIKPTAHNWARIPTGIYYCYNCGLQNSNGASGNIVMEDFTEKYGNGTAYVIGYWKRIPISFTPYVTINLHNPIVIDNIPEKTFVLFLNEDQFHFVNDEYVGLYVNIADVRAAVAELCKDYGVATFTPDMYDVGISFVPDGADSRFDYAIIFGDLVDSDNINYIIKEDEFFNNYVAEGKYIDYTVVSDVTVEWVFESYAMPDACVELLDESGKQIAYDDDGANYNNNFLLRYTLEAGKTYTVRVRWLSEQNAGYIPVAFDKQ